MNVLNDHWKLALRADGRWFFLHEGCVQIQEKIDCHAIVNASLGRMTAAGDA